jgi:uncharacterized membrane protein
MPNWLYIVAHVLYLLPLTIWIGGAVALGALVAPALFRSLPRHQAGGIFGPILRRFARLRLVCVVVLVLAAAWKYAQWETHAATPWMAIRWAAIALMAAIVLYELFVLERAMEATRPGPDAAESDPRRVTFMRLHKRSEALMKAGLIAALVALLLG